MLVWKTNSLNLVSAGSLHRLDAALLFELLGPLSLRRRNQTPFPSLKFESIEFKESEITFCSGLGSLGSLLHEYPGSNVLLCA